MRSLRLVILALLAVLVAAAVAQARTVDVPAALRDDLRRVAPRTEVPIRLPSTLPLDYDRRVHGDGRGSRRRYVFTLAAIPDCGNASACFLAELSAERGGRPSFRRTVELARGITGYYKPLSCGASCSPPMIQWVQRGVLYGIQAKIGDARGGTERRAMVRAANSAIRATPR